MKTTPAPLRALLDLAGRTAGFLFGHITWSAPAWLAWIGKRISQLGRHLWDYRLNWSIGMTSLALILGGVWKVLDWREEHRPRPFTYHAPQKLQVTWSAPAVQTASLAEKDLVPTPFTVRFSLPAAPMDKVGKEPGPGITMEPAEPGRWRWDDSQTLSFTPTAVHWKPGIAHTVTLDKEEIAPKLELAQTQLKFTTPRLEASVRNFDFYTSPKDPTVHQLVGELRFSHPVEVDEVIRHVALEVIGGTDVFATTAKDEPLFTVHQGNGPRQYYVRSRNLQIPEHEDFVRLRITKDLLSNVGGKALESSPETKARVPDKFSGFNITGSETRIIRTDEGEPQQILLIFSNKELDGLEVAKHVSVWWREEAWDLNDRDGLAKKTESAVKIALTPLPSEAPLSRSHAFRFTEPRPGNLRVLVEKGVKAPGGFELGQAFEKTEDIPEFPKEVEILGKGNILALGGSKRLVANSRGMDHLQVTLGRVPVSQLQHLVTQNRDGNFSSPDLDGYAFDEGNLVQRFRKVVSVPHENEWEAVQTEIDLSEAPPMLSPDAMPGGRGIFFVEVRPVAKEEEPEPEDTSVYSKIESPYDGEGWDGQEDDNDGTAYADGWTKTEGEATGRFVMITDLGLMVKAGADHGRDVFVMSLTAGLPVEGVALKVLARNGTTLAEAATDAEGRAKLPPLDGFIDEREPVAVLASKAEDITFLPLKERQLPAMDYSRFDIEGVMASRQKAVEGFLFTERGIYRPGDPISVGTLVRRRDWEAVIEGLPVRMVLTDSQGKLVTEERLRLPYDGFFETKLAIPETARLGNYEISAVVLNSKDEAMFRLGRTMVRVEEFQPDRSKVSARIEPAPPAGWMRPDPASVEVEVQSLFGEAAAERRVTMKLELSPTDFSFPDWEDYVFHDRSSARSASRAGREIDLGESKTGDDGKVKFSLPLDTLKDASFNLSITTEAFEREGGRSVKHSFSQLVSPWEEVLGWKADGDLDYIGKDSVRMVRMVAIDRTLKPVAMPKLHRRLIEIRQVSALTQLQNGNYTYVSTRHERVAAMEPLALAAGGTDLAINTGEAGNFRLEIVNDDDEILCIIPYRVAGKGDENRSLEREAELELVLGQAEVRPGEEIEVHLTAPYAGAGVVTLERDRVLSHQWFHTATNQSTVKLRVPQDIEGTVYVNAAFVRSPSSPEVFHSPLSYAAAPLRITPTRRQLEVKLDVPKTVRPGTEAHFGFTASQDSRVVLYAVDEGIHQITNYELPHPLDYFTRKQALEVRTLQWLDLLLPDYQFLKAAPAFGGDGGDEGLLSLQVNPFKRRQEAPVVFWSGIVQAGPERREVTWKVPDYFNGNLRVMAVAANAGGMGEAESDTLVKAPIILVPNTPLFASPGDEFEVSLAVTNNLEPRVKTTISVDASASSHLEPIGNPVATAELEAGKEGVLHFRFKAKEELGGAELKFVATGGGETITRTTTLSVRPATHFMTSVSSGYFRMGSQEVTTERTLYPQFRRGEATCSTLPLGLARGLEAYVSGFPHGCSEQITSRAMVKMLVSTEADFGLAPSVAAEHLRGAISQLANRQRADGGFGYWDGGGAGRSLDFHSLYVLHFLTEAKLLGHVVPEQMMKDTLTYAAGSARANLRNLDEAELQAYAIYLMARNGSAITPQLLNLRDTLTKRFAGQWERDATAAWMAGTYRLLKQDSEAEKLMAACVEARKKTPAGKPLRESYYYSSDQAETLKIFYIRCRHFQGQAAKFGYDDLEPIMGPLRDQSFNTLTASFMTLALKAYGDLAKQTGLDLEIYGKPAKGSESSLAGPVQGLVKAEFPEGITELSFRRDHKASGDLGAFYQAVQQGYDRGKLPGEQTSGIGIYREIKPAVEGKPLRPGDAINVKLTVRNLTPRNLPDLAVIDLLPAGFEVVEGDLKSGPGMVPGTSLSELREDRTLFYLGLGGNREWTVRYRMKAVCPGSFAVPSALVEDMYDRGRHGLSEPGRIEVMAAP